MNTNNIIKIKSNVDGPKVCILGGVHGNEIGGVNAIKKIVQNNLLKLTKGKVTFIIANEKGIEQNVRFVEENLNRCFKKDKTPTDTYEEKLAKEIMPILEKCDISLDLHASTSPNSEPFVICEKNAFELIKCLPMTKACSGFDKLQAGGTDSFMNKIGKIGICVECGYLGDKKSTEVALETIFTFLSILGMMKYPLKETPKKFLRIDELHLAKGEFKLIKEFDDFEFVTEGKILAYDSGKPIKAKKEGYLLFARNRTADEKDRETYAFMIDN